MVRGHELVGVVSREQVLRALADGSEDVPVTEVMVQDVPRLSVHTPLDAVTARMEEAQSRIAAVYDGGGFLGLVSAEDIAEVYMILGALRQNSSGLLSYEPVGPRIGQFRTGEGIGGHRVAGGQV